MSVFVSVIPDDVRHQAEILGVLTEDIDKATWRALNTTADRTRTILDKRVRTKVAFPAAYLRPSTGNLTVAERARNGNLEVVIRGRDRPTSLARFSARRVPGAPKGKKGIPVRVAPGVAKYIKRAFIIKLRNGNLGLAVRTTGGPPRGAYVPRRITDNLWLLYGPSVDQVLNGVRSRNDGLFGDVAPEALTIFETEFWRLIGAEVA